ncbi:GntR family transcriptional regulator [Acrocarpospora catenulata]|uniref:GntR family transcriptional regulator n=1 Tax=Acrocarpospora catenulata TaxID=2836182 RepID=UPI001BDA5A20|nr:winged helix-turn-helix domain-containing protein [Acrocarpospora catenulata]
MNSDPERLSGWRIYPRIVEEIRARIVAAEYQPGSLLPSEGVLCKEFSVARNTLRRALVELKNEGLLDTIPSKGWRVVGRSDPQHDRYKYEGIARVFRERIQTGLLPPGALVPSEAMLRQELGISRYTVRSALAVLEREGLLETRQGKGRYVTRRAPAEIGRPGTSSNRD